MGMDFAQAKHLLARLGMGVTPAALSRLRRQEADVAVQVQLTALDTQKPISWPAWVSEPIRPASAQVNDQRLDELRKAWARHMLTTDSPLIEHMVLFWHRHFGLPASRVGQAQWVARHHQILRKHATGNFRAMLQALMRDPALLMHLEANTSDRKVPATTLARALLTRYALPPDACTPQDIEAAAKAFTGWHVDTRAAKFRFLPRKHDRSTRTFLGRTGSLGAEAVLDILLEDGRVAEHLVACLWRRFISPTPDPVQVATLSIALQDANYDLAPLLTELLGSPAFRDPKHHNILLRDPVHCVIGTARSFYLTQADPMALAHACTALGMDLLEPPAQDLWPTNQGWFITGSLAQRQQVIAGLMRGDGPRGSLAIADPQSLARWLGRPGLKGARARKEAARLLLGGPPMTPVPEDADTHTMMLHLALDPQYQLM